MNTTFLESPAKLLKKPVMNEQRLGIDTTNVLAVGQSPRDRVALAACFRGARWQLLHADDVHAGIELLSGHTIHAVISDVNLPDGQWLDLRDRIEAGLSHLPIIIATERLDASLWAEVLSHGGYDVLVKPFQPEEVLYVVQTACCHPAGMRNGTQSRAAVP